ncbi:hypothetical protein ACFQDG_17550 [Natronoarchaeum mannanilyticum]|uniref:Uncharacterized protein n=1 Tax=Natronoarchaeum mannanilyticum TaxID=926360 RepID=A0AAV3T8D8_9EURY
MIGWLRDRLLGSSERGDAESGGRTGGSAPDEGSSSDDGTVWDLTPDWQIGDYRLQGATVPRGEQQDAVREVHERAAEMERELEDR